MPWAGFPASLHLSAIAFTIHSRNEGSIAQWQLRKTADLITLCIKTTHNLFLDHSAHSAKDDTP